MNRLLIILMLLLAVCVGYTWDYDEQLDITTIRTQLERIEVKIDEVINWQHAYHVE